METVDRLIRNLYFQVGTNGPLFLREHMQPINSYMIEVLKTPLGLIQSTLTIYYPISRYGEFEPIPMTYRVTPETTAWQLLQAIRDVYKEPVSESTIRAYMEKFPAHSIFLNRPNVTLKDLMFGATYVQGLSPYKEGYLLDLSG